MASLTDSLPGTSPVRRAAYAVGLVALFGVVFDFTWSQAIVVTVIVLMSESVELARPLPGLDERHFRLVLGFVAVAAGGVAYWAQGKHDSCRSRVRRRWLARAGRTLQPPGGHPVER